MDDVFAGGINFGYHITDHFNINTDFLYSSADLHFSSPGLGLNEDADFLAWTVNLDYYILPTRFTPFLTAGLGILSLDNGYDDYYYWYDWYYCCDQEIPFSDVNFLWNVGAGIRWDVTDNIFLKAAYRLSGSELEYSSDHMFMHSVVAFIGFRFGD